MAQGTPEQLFEIGRIVVSRIDPARLNRERTQQQIRDPDGFADRLVALLNAELRDGSYLRLLSAGRSIIVRATDGQDTLADATDVFRNGIDPDFRNWGCDVASEPTPEREAEVHELIRDGNFQQFFPSLSRGLGELCWAPSQIKRFCRDHENWLRTDGYATLFLFKVGDDYFVAYVRRRDARRLEVHVDRFSYDGVWDAHCRARVVVPARLNDVSRSGGPQLTPVPSGT